MHSSLVSEIAAHAAGLTAGIAAYALAGVFTHDAKTRLEIAVVVCVFCNAVVGGKINLALRDFVSLIVVRPISAFLGAELLKFIAGMLNG